MVLPKSLCSQTHSFVNVISTLISKRFCFTKGRKKKKDFIYKCYVMDMPSSKGKVLNN